MPQPPAAADAAVAPVPPPDPREAALSATVLRLLEQEHLLRHRIDDATARDAFATYMDRLDAGKMFLLRSDRDALAPYADKIDDELHSGTLELAHEGERIFVARVAVVDKLVAELLAAPMDFTNEEYLETDAKKLAPAATEDELRERWRQRLELEVLERVVQMEDHLAALQKGDKKAQAPTKKDTKDTKDAKGDPADDDKDEDKPAIPLNQIPPTPEGREAKARADLAKTYAGRFARLRHPEQLAAAADVINAVANALDPHTLYLPPANKANFDIQLSGSLEGIGALLREREHNIEISELVPGGASWRQGKLAPGDIILTVAQDGKDPVDVFDMRIDEVVKMIRGPKGTIVRLRIQKASGEQETIAITREVVVIEDAYARGAVLNHKGLPPLGYIHLPSFYGGRENNQHTAAGDVRRLLSELKARHIGGVVLDLRSNGGGLLRDAIDMTGQFIDQGPVVQVQNSRGHREVLDDDNPGNEFDGQVIVLVDRFSASASEIVAGALQDYGRALIVGTGPTHGKGTVQTVVDLDRASGSKNDLGALKITIQQFFRVSGASTQREGVTPDVVLPDPAGHIEAGERKLEHAIAWSKIEPAPYDHWPAKWKTSDLAEHSRARVAKEPSLSKIAHTTEVLRARQNETRIPLARPAWETRRKELRAALEAVSPNLKKAAAKFTVTVLGESSESTPNPNGRTDDRLSRWRDNLARDPWVEESLFLLADMAK